MVPGLQILMDHFTKAEGQHHFAVPASLFPNTQGAARKIDILNIQCGQRTGSKSQGSQHHDDNHISKAHGWIRLLGKVADQSFIFVFSQKLRYRFFYFWIGYSGSDIFRYDPVQGPDL